MRFGVSYAAAQSGRTKLGVRHIIEEVKGASEPVRSMCGHLVVANLSENLLPAKLCQVCWRAYRRADRRGK
jgi:hypothetical protein